MRRRKQRIDEHFSYKCVRRILKRLAYVIVFDELFGKFTYKFSNGSVLRANKNSLFRFESVFRAKNVIRNKLS